MTYGRRFAEAGYTAFVINHRAPPRFRYPAQSKMHSAPFDLSGITLAAMH